MPPETIDRTRINEAFDGLGRTPRICIEFASTPHKLDDYKEDVNAAILNITSDELRKLITDSTSLRMDSVSHMICLISRRNLDNVHSRAVVAPLTPTIQSRLANQFRNLERDEQLRFYTLLSKVPDSRATAGVFYEALGQRHMQNKIVLTIVPMVKLDQTPGSKKMPQWYSSHVLLGDQRLEVLRQQALQRAIEVNAVPLRTEEFMSNGPSNIERGVFYLPEATNHKSVDAFIWLGDFLYLFQFTIGETHYGVKAGTLPFFERYQDIPQRSHWRLVFIIPPNSMLASPQPWFLDLRDIALFSAVFDVHEK
jgi:hypothetical protein